jgi:hypothetical protein
MWGCRSESLQRWERAVGKSGAPLFNLPSGALNGDNNAWLDGEEDSVYYLAGGIKTVNVTSKVDAAVLYRSTLANLSSWELVSDFYTGSTADYAAIGVNCPDVWRNATGDSKTTVLMWLQHPPWHKPWDTAWTVGAQDNSSAAPRWAGRGLVDHSSAFIAAQSLNDANGRRVVFAWVQTPPSKVFVGLQSFPRELWLNPETQRLHSRPISEIATLRNGGVNSSARFEPKTATQTEAVVGVEVQHSFQLLLSIKLTEPMPDGASTGVVLFRGGGGAASVGLAVTLAQPACTNSSELLQSDLTGEDLATLMPPTSVGGNENAAAAWCHAQCCTRVASCRGWTSSHVLPPGSQAMARCRLKGSGAAVGTTGGGGCLAATMGKSGGEPDGSGNWRCISGLRGLELHVDGGGTPVPVYPTQGGEIKLNILADKMVAEVFVEDARGEGAAAITAVFGGVCANCTGATLFAEGGAAVAVEVQSFVVAASSAQKRDDVPQ